MTKHEVTHSCGHVKELLLGSFSDEQKAAILKTRASEPCMTCQCAKVAKKNRRAEKYHRYF